MGTLHAETTSRLQALSDQELPGTLRTTTRSPAASSPCRWRSERGSIGDSDARTEKHWSCTITLPPSSTLELQAEEEVTIDIHPGRRYRIVHAPGPGSVNVARVYGAVEV